MGRFRDLSVRVTSVDREPIESARVTAERDGQPIAGAVSDEQGRCALERDDDGALLIRVEADGVAADERVVTGDRPEHIEAFVLGREGLPFYYRGNVRVPFEPVTDAVGVVVRSAAGASGDKAAVAEQVADSLGASVIRSGGNFAGAGIAVVAVPAGGPQGDVSVEAVLERLDESGEVERAGALVNLSADHASFLTDGVIAEFEDGVDDAAVAEIAARHGLRDEGRIEALGNVHTLRFEGAATYAVLDASNGLNNDPRVVFAEPDLVHTVEDDAVTPTDFLFPQQWDHSLIRTPDAWQVLSDIDISLTFGSPDVIIAVVDTGVDITHPEIAGQVSNGQPKVHKVYDFANGTANMNDLDRDHGTACASAAAASTNNASAVAGVNEGIAGVAGNCRLIAVRRGGSELRYAFTYLWAAGLPVPPLFAPPRISPGADIITSSFGVSVDVPISGLMRNVFDALTRDGRRGKGTVLFFSAGNDNVDLDTTFRRPWSMYERCFGVAASTLDNTGATEVRAGYSDFGSTVDFCAPSNDDDNFNIPHDPHNPPQAYGANAATIQAAPDGDAIPGRPDNQSTLSVAAAQGATVLTLAATAGMAAGQALLIGASGAIGTESRRIRAVNGNQLTVEPGLDAAHAVGTAVASGPRSYQNGFGGTSYATPVCAGTAALVLSAGPQLRWEQVGDILRATAVKIDPNNIDPTGRWRDDAGRISTDPGYTGPLFSEFYGFGRIDAAAAVRTAAATAVQGEFYASDGQGGIGRLAAHSGWRSSWTAIVQGNFGGSGHTDLLFYDASVGHGEFWTTDGQGNISLLGRHEGWRTSWTAIVPGNFGGGGHTDLLFYDASVGHGEFWTTDGQGNISLLGRHEGWRTSWTAIVPGNFGGGGHTDLLFYDASVGHGEFWTTDGQGGISQLRLHDGWRGSWTAIVAGNFGGGGHTDLLFYDASMFQGEFWATDGQGGISQLRLHDGWRGSWTAIVAGNFGGGGHTDLLFYDASMFQGEFWATDGQGGISQLRLHDGWRGSWTAIVAGEFGGGGHTDLLFYDPGA